MEIIWRISYHVYLKSNGRVIIDSDSIRFGTRKELEQVKNTRDMTITKKRWTKFVSK